MRGEVEEELRLGLGVDRVRIRPGRGETRLERGIGRVEEREEVTVELEEAFAVVEILEREPVR
jgi:hypothetical protein